MDGVTFIEINYDQAWIDSSLLGLAGFSWLYSWGMYLFLIATLGILIWIFFDSITKHKDQQALVPRILAMVGFFLIFPAFIFRFTGNADGIHTLVRLGGEPGTPYYAGPINWNVNWLVKGYGPMIAMVALAGVVVSIVAMVIYASTVQRSKVSIGGVGGTMFGNNLNDRMAALENEVQNVQRAAATPTPIPSAPIPSAPIPSSMATITSGVAPVISFPSAPYALETSTGRSQFSFTASSAAFVSRLSFIVSISTQSAPPAAPIRTVSAKTSTASSKDSVP